MFNIIAGFRRSIQGDTTRKCAFSSLVCACLALSLMPVLSGCPRHRGPAASFTAAPLSGPVPLDVQFTNTSRAGDAPITAWEWDFGDGETANEPNPLHRYELPGTYTPRLRIVTRYGQDTFIADEPIVVEGVCVEPGNDESEGPLVEIPDPLSGDNPRFPIQATALPAPGQIIVDAELHTSQRRITQALSLRHEYSRHDPFNADQSLIILTYFPEGDWRVYRTDCVPYDSPENYVANLNLVEPRWDPQDAHILWAIRDLTLVTIDLRDPETVVVVKDFTQDPVTGPFLQANPDIYCITMADEGEPSDDMRYWAFLMRGTQDDYRFRAILTWDREGDQVIALRVLSTAESDIDWVGMSPKGTYALVGGLDPNGGNLAGLTMATRDLTQFHRLDFTTAHADVGLDSDGNEVVVMQNNRTDYVDLIPIDWATQPILETGGDYTGTNRVPLVRLYYAGDDLGLNSGVHISCNYPGYAVISTNTEPGLAEQNWLDRKIVLVSLDRSHPRAFYLAQVHGTRGGYWEETQASITRDGRKIIWATNWNQNVGHDPELVWDMLLSLPADWTSALLPLR